MLRRAPGWPPAETPRRCRPGRPVAAGQVAAAAAVLWGLATL